MELQHLKRCRYIMRYEGTIYRPPSEARSLIIQVTIGCSHNKCTFCSMYKDKTFRVRDFEDVLDDLKMAKEAYGRVDRIFYADGDALCLSNEKLLKLLSETKRIFPEVKRITSYGSPLDVLRKTDEELKALQKAGLDMVYIGAESGDEEILKAINKGATRDEIIEGVRRLEKALIKTSVTFISGLGGKKNFKEHGINSGTMISQMEPSYVGLLTLMVERNTPLYEDVKEGTFELLSPLEVMEETLLLLENINVSKKCVFRSNHASNYFSLRGDLPQDKDRMMNEIKEVIKSEGMLKDERFRML